MTPEECKKRGINCGIWQGRFQCVHNGHYFIYDTVLKEFEEQIIAIVNPNPDVPADKSFIRFGSTTNPLNYFQRMLLWKEIIVKDNRRVSVVPCWHARKSVNLEREFLPVHTRLNPKRCWILPLYQDDNELQKARDLEALGEVVCDANWENESVQDRSASASYVRHTLDSNNTQVFEELVPPSIADLTKMLYFGEDPFEYRIVVLIGDSIDFSSLQRAVCWAKESIDMRRVVVAIAVKVSSNDDGWWFERAQTINNLSFYQKMKEIERIFYEINFSGFLITPIFIQNSSFRGLWEYSAAFLPSIEKSKWIINRDCIYEFGFSSMEMNSEQIANEDCRVTEDYYLVFQKRTGLSPLKTNIHIDDKAQKLISEIESFVRVHLHSEEFAERELAERFKDCPDEIKRIIHMLQYNHISIDDYMVKLNTINRRWQNK